MAVTLAEKIWEKERAKVEKCPSAPNRCEKKLFPSRVGNQGDFDSHGQKYFPVREHTSPAMPLCMIITCITVSLFLF